MTDSSIPDLVLRARRAVLPGGAAAAAVWVRQGRIRRVGGFDDVPAGVSLVDAGDLWLLPGLVDAHVHMNEPGRTDWEGAATATRAAAAGGVTTVVDMPLNSIPATVSVAALEEKRRAISAHCHVDVGLWAGLVPGNLEELANLWREGVLGFKAFLAPSGVDEFAAVEMQDLERAAPDLAAWGAPLLVHAEWPAALRAPTGDPRAYATYLASRPPVAESEAIRRLLALCAATRVPLHVVHVATGEALPLLGDARERGLPVTAETCPHYLTFAAEQIADGATAWKCAPPIRGAAERERLWRGLQDGVLDAVVSDHSPSPPALKRLEEGRFDLAWGGIGSLEIAPRAVWTGARARGFDLEQLVRWTSAGPARIAGLQGRKGAIAEGCDADLVIFDPDASSRVSGAALSHRHPLTPYEGLELRGAVRQTFLRGELIYDNGAFAPARGTILSR